MVLLNMKAVHWQLWGWFGYEVTLNPEAAIFVPLQRESALVLSAHNHFSEDALSIVTRTTIDTSSTSRHALMATGHRSLYVKGSLEGQTFNI
jgi:hypothetical protein